MEASHVRATFPPRRPRSVGPATPPVAGAREALADVVTRSHRVGEHLALIEMLLAVGPAVRDAGALEDAVDLLDEMARGVMGSIQVLRETCSPLAES